MFVQPFKGGNTVTLSRPINYHKVNNNEAYRAIWDVLWHAMEQGWLGRL